MQNITELDIKIKNLSEKIEDLNEQLSELEIQRIALKNESLDLKSYIGKYYKNIATPITYYRIDDMTYYGDFFNNVKIKGPMLGLEPFAYMVYEDTLVIRKENLTEITKEEFMEIFDQIINKTLKTHEKNSI